MQASEPTLLERILSQRMLLCCATGFASGMPLYVLYQLIPAWLRDQGVDLKTIGLFALISIPYVWKFLWAPLMDRPFFFGLGRRRGWGLFNQVLLLLLLASLSLFNPTDHIEIIAGIAFCIAFCSATQDIVIDAYRREILPDEELGFGNSLFVNAYRLSSLVPGSLALLLADHFPWAVSHLVVASFMLVGITTSLLMPEPTDYQKKETGFLRIVIAPLQEFVNRNGIKQTVLILLFMLFYKLGDSMATALSTPFYLDMGFTKTDIASIVKVASLWSSIVGGFFGGLVMIKIGINRSLWYFGVIQMVTILGFAWLAHDSSVLLLQSSYPDLTAEELVAAHNITVNKTLLFVVVSAEYLGVGLGTAAFVSFIAKSTNKAYTAAQFALLTSLSGIPRTFAASATGYLIEAMGYFQFFLLCTILAIPGMVLLIWVAPTKPNSEGD